MADEASLIDFFKGIIRGYFTLGDAVEHVKFFNFGFSMNTENARSFASRYIATCHYLNNNPGFGAAPASNIWTSASFDAEFAKAGLGTIVRDAKGGTNIKLRIASHLEGKTDSRDALKNMAPSRRSALLMEIQKINAISPSAFNFRSAMSAVGVRG